MSAKCFSCYQQECNSSCCGAFTGFSDRLNSVDGRKFSDIILTDKDAKAILSSKYRELVYKGQDGLYRLKTAEDGACSAYIQGKCSINDLKPTICKCFPLYLDVFIGLCSQKDCIAADSRFDFQNYRNEIEPLLDMYEFWTKYYRTRMEEYKTGE